MWGLLGIFQISIEAPGKLTKVFQCEIIFPVTCLICVCVCVCVFEVNMLMFVLSHSPVNTILSIIWLSQACKFKC